MCKETDQLRDPASEASGIKSQRRRYQQGGAQGGGGEGSSGGREGSTPEGVHFSRNLEKIIESCSYLDLVITFTFLQQ